LIYVLYIFLIDYSFFRSKFLNIENSKHPLQKAQSEGCNGPIQVKGQNRSIV